MALASAFVDVQWAKREGLSKCAEKMHCKLREGEVVARPLGSSLDVPHRVKTSADCMYVCLCCASTHPQSGRFIVKVRIGRHAPAYRERGTNLPRVKGYQLRGPYVVILRVSLFTAVAEKLGHASVEVLTNHDEVRMLRLVHLQLLCAEPLYADPLISAGGAVHWGRYTSHRTRRLSTLLRHGRRGRLRLLLGPLLRLPPLPTAPCRHPCLSRGRHGRRCVLLITRVSTDDGCGDRSGADACGRWCGGCCCCC